MQSQGTQKQTWICIRLPLMHTLLIHEITGKAFERLYRRHKKTTLLHYFPQIKCFCVFLLKTNYKIEVFRKKSMVVNSQNITTQSEAHTALTIYGKHKEATSQVNKSPKNVIFHHRNVT